MGAVPGVDFERECIRRHNIIEKERCNPIKDIWKIISYPIFGGFSHNFKNKLERKVGKDWFDAIDATVTNMLFSIPAYPIMANVLTYQFTGNKEYAFFAFMGGFVAAIIEGFSRLSIGGNAGSLLGKIASLPFEGKEKAQEYYK